MTSESSPTAANGAITAATPSSAKTFLYRACFALAALTACVAVAFFGIGVADGSVSSFNMGLWLMLMGVIGAALWAGPALRSRGHTTAAVAVLALVALPVLAGVLFMLIVIVTNPHWN